MDITTDRSSLLQFGTAITAGVITAGCATSGAGTATAADGRKLR